MSESWSKRAEAGDGLPNLGLAGTLLTAFVTSYFAAKAAGVLMIFLTRGWHAFVVEGLRVKDWKHGIMSNGEPLPFPGTPGLGLMTFVLWIVLIGSVELVAGFVPGVLKRCGSWAGPAARLIGGAFLVTLSFWFYSMGTFALIHPVPFAPLVGGTVLIWKGIAISFREHRQKDSAELLLERTRRLRLSRNPHITDGAPLSATSAVLYAPITYNLKKSTYL